MNYKSLKNATKSSGTFAVLFTFLSVYAILRIIFEDSRSQLPAHLRKYVVDENSDKLDESYDIDKLKLVVEKMNSKQYMSNEARYGPAGAQTPVLVVQVQRDLARLRGLVASLAQVRGIHTALLIFSHTYFHHSINNLVQSIDFCKVMQIYFPFSVQLNPHKFPGVDPEDCAPGAESLNCLRRDARVTEHKQHWWWKANFVFQRISCTRARGAPFIFLEEDNVVTPDLLHMFQYLRGSFKYFPDVQVLSFGKPVSREINMDLLTVEPWQPPFDVGLSFNRSTWNRILSLSAEFCMHDDYSWSYSLLRLFQNFPGGRVSMVACMSPRVVSTKQFKNTKEILGFTEYLYSLELFPQRVQATTVYGWRGRVECAAGGGARGARRGAGGWGDLRDQLLCLDPLASTTTEEKRYDEFKV